MTAQPLSLLAVLKKIEQDADSLTQSGESAHADGLREAVARVRALLKQQVGFYLEHQPDVDRDRVRFILADELVYAVKASRAESIAQKFERRARSQERYEWIEAAAEVRKLIELHGQEARSA